MKPDVLWLFHNPVTLPMLISLDKNGIFNGEFPALPGCHAQGTTLCEAVANLSQAIQQSLHDLKES